MTKPSPFKPPTLEQIEEWRRNPPKRDPVDWNFGGILFYGIVFVGSLALLIYFILRETGMLN